MPDQDYSQFKQEAEAAGAPVQTVAVPDYGTVHFFEKARPGPLLSYVGHTFRCERTFVVWPYADAWGFCAWMVGWSYLKTADEAGEEGFSSSPGDYEAAGVYRRIPQPLTIINKRNGRPLAYATEVSKFMGLRPSGVLDYDDTHDGVALATGDFYAAEVTVVYGALPYRVLTDEQLSLEFTAELSTFPNPVADQPPREATLRRYVNRVGAPSAKHLQHPSGTYKWEGVGLPASRTLSDGSTTTAKARSSQTTGRMIPYADITYTWYQVPGLPKAIFTGAIGKVNSLPFDEFDAETLLLTSVELTPHRMVTGERSYDIAYRFRHLTGNNPSTFDDGDTPVDGTYNFADSGHNYFLRYFQTGSGDNVTYTFVWDRPFTGPDANGDPNKKWVFESMLYDDLFRGPFTTGLWVAT